ncbi:mRNA interferase MazF [Enterococcus sp. AZ194]|uniref:type II toxin-antitoxin system PemK/MazF family toxin n=1 Tax=Enterococcus sp. AZ194 TaxID=2774629 RepID=UPI003F1F4D83
MYFPKQKDIIWMDFDPSRGKEIRKRRPALVVSKTEFNEHTGFCLVCPITSTKREFATYIEIKDPQEIRGEVVTHQLRSIDYMTRNVEKIEQCDLLTWIDIVEVLNMFI